MNFQLKCEEIIEDISERRDRPSLLLHACCAPCSSYVLEYLSKHFTITILYYNPNIYPEEEYHRRLEELKKFLGECEFSSSVSLVETRYLPEEYYNEVSGYENLGERSKRCYRCYAFRMKEACLYALKNKMDYFTTTLSISPYKNSEWINEIGKELEQQYKVQYLYADFKKKNGYKRSLELSKKYNLYRQDYCGCEFSKKERENFIKK